MKIMPNLGHKNPSKAQRWSLIRDYHGGSVVVKGAILRRYEPLQGPQVEPPFSLRGDPVASGNGFSGLSFFGNTILPVFIIINNEP